MPEPTEQTPPAETPQEAPKVTPFDEGQKARINEIVREASARAGSEARAEVARLKATLPVEAQGTETLLRLAQAESELATLRNEATESKLSEVLHKAASSQPFFDSALAAQILRASVRVIDGVPTVVNPDGTPRLNSEYRQMQPAELAKELAESKRFLVRSDFKGGAGSVANASPSPANAIPLETIFGRTSDGGAATRLAMRDPKRYQAMKKAAREAGLIS